MKCGCLEYGSKCDQLIYPVRLVTQRNSCLLNNWDGFVGGLSEVIMFDIGGSEVSLMMAKSCSFP